VTQSNQFANSNCFRIAVIWNKQGSATYSSPNQFIPLAAPLQIVLTVMAHLVAQYFVNLPFLQHLVLHTYEELLMRNCTML